MRTNDLNSDSTTGSGVDADEQPVVLVVDDEIRITQAFQLWLGDGYDVRTATSGEEAFEKLDDAVDVVLLDRQMPGLSGREVLEHIREEGYGCRVAMVTGVDPDFDIVDMPFDDYVQKPVDRKELREVVERMLALNAFEARVREYFSGTRKQAALESRNSESALEGSESYDELLDRLDQREEQLRETLQQFGDEQFDPERVDTLFDELLEEFDRSDLTTEE